MHVDAADTMSDEWAIGVTLARYCRAVDDHRFDQLAEIFTTDARLHTMGRTLAGHDEILAFFGPMSATRPDRPATADALSNVLVELDGDTASVESDWMMLARNDTGATRIALAGRYRDRMARDGSTWRIADREVVALARPRPVDDAVKE